MAAGGLSKNQERLDAGVEILKKHRDGKGGWRRFPFHYTMLALADMHANGLASEMQYAAPRLERMLKRSPRGDSFDLRRREVAGRILARV